ncbi:helix-turn-helix transcriptional regulator [Streptomyces sp. C]|uniref:helix-turn-helix domain-containing protein n=1 Tax=Streptomyces sp. C TaxID=253839 RepID=UPI0002E6EFA7|nr:helix-turn-helix transcriptional regulator [Streptomyces sp. C]
MEKSAKQHAREAVTDLELKFIEAVEHGRLRAELTYEQLGRHLGMSKSQISKRQDGQITYTLRDMHHISQLLGIDPLVMAAGLGTWLNYIHPTEVHHRLDTPTANSNPGTTP